MLPHILVIHRTLHPTFQRILCRILCRKLDRFASPFTWQHSVASLCVVGLLASGPWSVAQSIDFTTDVLPILSEHCLSCHGADQQESQLRLDSMLDALRGGDSGEQVIVPGQSHKSHLIERIVSPDPALRMPPPEAARLSESQVTVLKVWIDRADHWQASQNELATRRSEHWSFQPISSPTIPAVDQSHPIDAFIQFRLAQDQLTLSPRSDRRRLLRRLYLVMHGLPPTPEQVSQFLSDERPDAWQRWVDDVLDSPQYGQRWAMHWLDLIRFGETNGFETNRERPHAYHYRDWVVDAFNQDKPYDQFVREQIAGDALGEPMATGFLVAGPNDIVKGQDKLLGLMQRQDELSDIVNTVGTALLGLTTGCARCHNHKFDPISQVDFYALQAIFAGVEHGDRDLPLAPDQQQQVDALNEAITQTRHELSQLVGVSALREAVNPQQNSERFPARNARYVRFTINQSSSGQPCIDELEIFSGQTNVGLASAGARATSSGNFEHPLHKLAHLNDGRFGNPHSWICSQTKAGWAQIELPQPMEIDRIEWGRDREGKFADRLAIDYRIDVSLDGQTWESVASSENRLPFQRAPNSRQRYDLSQVASGDLPKAQAALQRLDDLQQRLQTWLTVTKVYAGTFKQPPVTHRLFRGDPTAPREEVPPGAIQSLGSLSLPANATDQQRRLAIADWITRADNPLAPRVIVNRLWQFHFGTGIVDTPSDFGANGTPPSHPELLDWLANELVNSGWSLKHIHRLILTSKTWQQSSQPQANALAIDAQSRLLWRFPPRRLEAEPIRDSLLAVSGNLDLNMGGPGFSAFEVELENVRHYFPKQNYGPADWRRMIYMTKVRQEKDSTFGVFDCPDASQVTPKRSRSTTPLQALNLLNGRFVLQQAELLAKRLSIEAPTNSARIQLAYELCFSRAADAAEQAAAADFIDQHGLVSFTRAILNANEFVFVP